MGVINDFFNSLNKAITTNLPPQPKVPDHPMTYAEYKHYNDSVLIGRAIGNIIRNTHNHFQQQRWHDETIEAIRELKER